VTLTVRSGDVCGIAVSQRTGQTNKQTNDIVEKQERGLKFSLCKEYAGEKD